MKKIVLGLVFLIFVTTNSIADSYQPYVAGQIVEKNLSLGKGKYNIPLPPGKFTIAVTHESLSTGSPTTLYELKLIKGRDKTIDEMVYVKISKQVSTHWLIDKDCKRTNLYFIKFYAMGSAQSCWFVNHYVLTLSSDKIKSDSFQGKLRDYIFSKQLIVPNNLVYSSHIYASARQNNVYFRVYYMTNPDLRGVPKSSKTSWSQSEYQIVSISSYPEKKAFMDSYVIKSAGYQKNFENGINMLAEHRLDTSMAVKKQTLENAKSKSNTVNELSDLNKLYKSGVLSKEEFEKAKKKILN
jgi:hypothetical protein